MRFSVQVIKGFETTFSKWTLSLRGQLSSSLGTSKSYGIGEAADILFGIVRLDRDSNPITHGILRK